MQNRLAKYFKSDSNLGSSFSSPLFGANFSMQPFDIFDQLLSGLTKHAGKAYSISKTENGDLLLQLEYPGFTAEELNVEVENGFLYIGVNTKSTKYERSFQLPDRAKIEEISAELKNGVLTVLIPFQERQIKRIQIQTD